MLKKMAPALKGEHKQMHQVEIHKTEDKQQQTILKQQQEGTDEDKEREGLATEDNWLSRLYTWTHTDYSCWRSNEIDFFDDFSDIVIQNRWKD